MADEDTAEPLPAEQGPPVRDLPGGGFVDIVGAAGRALKDAAGVVVPLYLGAGLVLLGLQFAANLGYGRLRPDSPALVPIVLVLGLLPPLVGSVLAGVTAVAAGGRLAGGDPGLRYALSTLGERRRDVGAAALLAAMLALFVVVLPPALVPGVADLVSILVTIAAVLIGPPLVMQAVVLERLRFQQALARARLLWQGHLGRVFLYLFVLAFLAQLLAALATQAVFAGGRAGLGLPRPAAGWLAVGVNSALLWLTYAYLAVVALLCYLDIRVRKEALDLQGWRAELERNGVIGPRPD